MSVFISKLVGMRKTKRDIYKLKMDRTFIPERDIDLADLRRILTTSERTEEDKQALGQYIDNVAKILLKSSKFCGYPDAVKNDIKSLGCWDAITGCDGFDGDKYPNDTAPFSYIYRIIYNRAGHVVMDYYKKKAVPFSSLPDVMSSNITDNDDEGLAIYNHDEGIKERSLAEFFKLEKEVVAPTDIVRSRVRKSIRCVLQRRIQLQLNLV